MSDDPGGWRSTNLGRYLFRAQDRCRRDKIARVHATGFGDVSDAMLTLFVHLDDRGARLTLLAARAGLTKQSMIELVDRAQAVGLVERVVDPTDLRAKVISPTEAGQALIVALREAVEAVEREIAAAVGEQFLSTMKSKLANYAQPMSIDAERWPVHSTNVASLLALASRRFAFDILSAMHRRDVSETMLGLFRNLDLGGTRLTALATRSHITKQSMRELVDQAEAMGWVQRTPHPSDGRAKIIGFTEQGLALLDEMRIAIIAAEAGFQRRHGLRFASELKIRLQDYIDFPRA